MNVAFVTKFDWHDDPPSVRHCHKVAMWQCQRLGGNHVKSNFKADAILLGVFSLAVNVDFVIEFDWHDKISRNAQCGNASYLGVIVSNQSLRPKQLCSFSNGESCFCYKKKSIDMMTSKCLAMPHCDKASLLGVIMSNKILKLKQFCWFFFLVFNVLV